MFFNVSRVAREVHVGNEGPFELACCPTKRPLAAYKVVHSGINVVTETKLCKWLFLNESFLSIYRICQSSVLVAFCFTRHENTLVPV